jgi:hypothetical protein
MSTPGFKFEGRDVKANGTAERIELNSNNFALKKYTCPDGSRYVSVQPPGIKHKDFSNSVGNIDIYVGFRSIFDK